MAVLPILRWPDARLSQVCAAVTRFDPALETLARDMFDTMYDAPGRGLAGPQVGAMQRLFVMDVTWKDADPSPVVMVNPTLLAADEQTCVMAEGCLSIPGLVAEVARPVAVRMRWQDLTGAAHEADLTGNEARCAQHELDHLDGKVHFDRISAEQRALLEEAYR